MVIKQIVMHVKFEEDYSRSDVDTILEKAINEIGGNVIEIEKHIDSCYTNSDIHEG